MEEHRNRIAIHEAGHAVVAAHHSAERGYSLLGDEISIEPNTVSAGRVGSQWRNADAEQQVQVSLGGILAERITFGGWSFDSLYGALDDLKRALDLSRSSGTTELAGSLDWSIREASSILLTRRSALDEISRRLAEKKRLSAATVRQIVTSSDPRPSHSRVHRRYPYLRKFLLNEFDTWWKVWWRAGSGMVSH